MKSNEVAKKVGYGYGTVVGFTDDGQVFVVSDTDGPDGQPMTSTSIMNVKRATEIADSLVKAADAARAIKNKGAILGDVNG